MKSIKEKSGITLIALAVTIIVILILAAVTIGAVFSDDGIINKAKEAANSMNNAVANDQTSLNELFNELNDVMNGMGGSGDSNTEIPDPEPEKPTDIEDVTDIQDKTVQVEDEYGNKVTIPKGFEVVEEEGTTVPEGIVIQDKDGNQFVWIPVGRVYKDNTGTNYSDIQLGRYTFNTSNGTPTLIQAAYTAENPENYKQLIGILNDYGFDCFEYVIRENPDGIESDGADGLNAIAKNLEGFVNSVKRNYGYYIGRYEASYGSGSNAADYKPLSKISTSTTFSKSKVGSLWNNVTQIEAAKISRNMYNNDSNVRVESDLVNSYAYDTAIVFIQEMGHTNYANKCSVNVSKKNTGKTGDEVCNIHDMASNCYEWTTEYCADRTSSDALPCVYRGGSYLTSYFYTAYKQYSYATYKDIYNGFRVIIYVK